MWVCDNKDTVISKMTIIPECPLFIERVFMENTTGYLSTVSTGSKEAL